MMFHGFLVLLKMQENLKYCISGKKYLRNFSF